MAISFTPEKYEVNGRLNVAFTFVHRFNTVMLAASVSNQRLFSLKNVLMLCDDSRNSSVYWLMSPLTIEQWSSLNDKRLSQLSKREKYFFIGGTLGKWPHIRERLFRRKRKMRWLEQRAHLEVIPWNPTNEPWNPVSSHSTQQDLFISCITNHCKPVLNREETSRDVRLRTRTLFQCSVLSSQYFVTLPATDDRVASSAPG